MPPSSTLSVQELIETIRRSADAQLQQAAASNRQATALERLLSPFERISRDLADIKDDRELDNAKLDLAIGEVKTQMALILDNVKTQGGDVRQLSRDVTGTHPLPRDERTTAERVIDRFEKLPVATKLLLLVFIILLAASGWLAHLIGS